MYYWFKRTLGLWGVLCMMLLSGVLMSSCDDDLDDWFDDLPSLRPKEIITEVAGVGDPIAYGRDYFGKVDFVGRRCVFLPSDGLSFVRVVSVGEKSGVQSIQRIPIEGWRTSSIELKAGYGYIIHKRHYYMRLYVDEVFGSHQKVVYQIGYFPTRYDD